MKVILVLLLLGTLVTARPQRAASPNEAVILKYESENDGQGQYRFAYETSDGQTREEQAVLKNAGTDNEAISVMGSYSYVGPDGVTYSVRYIADENGFRPEGEHIPKRTHVGLPAAALGSLVGGGIGK